jgi:hypothetical protein
MYEVRDGDGNAATTASLELARSIRAMMLEQGARVAIIWNERGERVPETGPLAVVAVERRDNLSMGPWPCYVVATVSRVTS